MTTFEHAMVGATATLAVGLQRRFGWQIVAVAAAVAISPDWDGLPFLFSIELFDRVHRVWGHNLWVCGLVGAAIAAADLRWDWTSRGRLLLEWLLDRRALSPLPSLRPNGRTPVWLAVGVLAAWSHLPADMVYSGNADLGDWPLQLWWPFSTAGYVLPLVPWGDIGASVLFTLGILAMLRFPRRVEPLAAITLAAVVGYIILRGLLRS